MLRLCTKVTASPTVARRRSSATSATIRTSGPRAPKSVTISAVAHLLAQGDAGQDLGHRAAAGRGTGRAAVRSSSAGGGSSPPEHQEASRARPSASEASSTGKRSAGSSQRPGSWAKEG